MSNGKILSCPDTKLVEHVSWRSEFLCRVWISEDTCSNGITGAILAALSMQGKLLHFLNFRMGSLPCTQKYFVHPSSCDQKEPTFFSSRARARTFYGQSEFLQQWSLGRMEKGLKVRKIHSVGSCSEVISCQAQMSLIHWLLKSRGRKMKHSEKWVRSASSRRADQRTGFNNQLAHHGPVAKTL